MSGLKRRGLLLIVLGLGLVGCSSPSPPVGDRGAATSPTPSGTQEELMSANALLDAARNGELSTVEAAVAQDVDLEVRDSRGRTPLLLAVTGDHVDVARALVAGGADPNAIDDQSDTPWLVTGVTGSVSMLEVLLAADPDLTLRNRYGGNSLIPACERGHVDYVREVLKTGIDVNHVNDLGWTGLLEAVILGDGSTPYQQIVQLLIDNGADTGLADADGVTALDHANARGQTEIAQLLRAA